MLRVILSTLYFIEDVEEKIICIPIKTQPDFQSFTTLRNKQLSEM